MSDNITFLLRNVPYTVRAPSGIGEYRWGGEKMAVCEFIRSLEPLGNNWSPVFLVFMRVFILPWLISSGQILPIVPQIGIGVHFDISVSGVR